MTAITRFRGAYAFLSNFYSSPIEVNGIVFPTVEHAFQAAKADLNMHPALREQLQRAFSELKTPAEAKRLGRDLPLRADWKQNHLRIMARLLALKFVYGGKFAALLMNTRGVPLIEGNDWNDTYWGVCRGQGRNQLGVLLMELRDDLWEQAIDEGVEAERDELNGCNTEDRQVRNDRINAEALLRYPDEQDASTTQALALHDALGRIPN